MEDRWGLLVVSVRLENRRALMHILEGLPVLVFTASTVEQAQDVLSNGLIRLVFCEECLSDGSYRDLLPSLRAMQTKTPLILMLCTGEWDEYLEAMKLGVRDVIRCPLQPTDVELAMIRAARDLQISEHAHLRSHGTKDDTNSSGQGFTNLQVV